MLVWLLVYTWTTFSLYKKLLAAGYTHPVEQQVFTCFKNACSDNILYISISNSWINPSINPYLWLTACTSFRLCCCGHSQITHKPLFIRFWMHIYIMYMQQWVLSMGRERKVQNSIEMNSVLRDSCSDVNWMVSFKRGWGLNNPTLVLHCSGNSYLSEAFTYKKKQHLFNNWWAKFFKYQCSDHIASMCGKDLGKVLLWQQHGRMKAAIISCHCIQK